MVLGEKYIVTYKNLLFLRIRISKEKGNKFFKGDISSTINPEISILLAVAYRKL